MRPLFFSVLVLTTSAFVSTSMKAQNPSFQLKHDKYPAFSSTAITKGDFNRDGKPDIVYAGSETSPTQMTLRLGNGDGTFRAPVIIGQADSAQIMSTATGDFNNDGNPDVAVLCIGGTFDVFYGDGQGGIRQTVATATSYSPRSMTIADLDKDGLADIAIGDAEGNVEIFNNVAGNSFLLKRTIPVSPNADIKVAAGDFDNNGIQSLAALSSASDGLYVLWNDGNGNFTKKALQAVTTPGGLAVGDLNQDGMADILVSYGCGALQTTSKGDYSTCQGVTAFYGQGQQKLFQRTLIQANGFRPATDLRPVDINGDGIGDVVAVSTTTGAQTGLFTYLGHPDGSFDQVPSQFIATTDSLGALVAGDFNRDGMMDFVASQAEIFLNATQRAACATSQISPSVNVCAPVNDTYLPGPKVLVQANAFDTKPITAIQLYANGALKTSQAASTLNQEFQLGDGYFFLVVKAWDASGMNFRSQRGINVYSGTAGSVCSATLGAASICLPAGLTSAGQIHILANGYSPVVPTSAQLYIDGRLVVEDRGCNTNNYCGGGTSFIDTNQSLAAGTHDLVFKLWDANGQVYTDEKKLTLR